MKSKALRIFILFLFFIVGCNSQVQVTQVIDGDTFLLSDGNIVRVLGIDFPDPKKMHSEWKVYNLTKERTQDCYDEGNRIVSKILIGEEVTLIKSYTELNNSDYIHIDKYGRLLRYVEIGDIELEAFLLKNGYAIMYDPVQPPLCERCGYYKTLEVEARENKVGCLWE